MTDVIHVGIDVGGTFTDVTVHVPGRAQPVLYKLPSTPDAPDRAIIDGVQKILSAAGLSPAMVGRISHGTTVGTNALIQRKIGTVGLVTTRGFRDLLEIGRQTRPRVYDIHLDHPPPIVPRERRHEVDERMLSDGRVHRPLSRDGLREVAAKLRAQEVDSVVVCFLNAYAYPAHEEDAVCFLSQELPASTHVIASSSIYPEFREYERFSTAVLNAALLTVMNDYLDRFSNDARDLGIRVAPEVSQSVGGLMSIDMAREVPLRASLSGPAAGVIGAASRATASGAGNIITLDMGGTSADVSLLVEGQAAEVQNRTLAGYPLRMPTLDVNAVGAGGGSIAWIDRDGLLKVGPHSAGAHPGPACYGLGGQQATVTDANVVLGRLNQDAFLDGTMPIESNLANRAVADLADTLGLGLEETALGIIQVTSAVMVKAIRAISVERGHDPTQFTLFAFGGAGPLHATEVARELDITKVLIPPNPGILCAEGLLQSDLRADFVRTVLRPLAEDSASAFESTRELLVTLANTWFAREGVAPDDQDVTWSADMRYIGQNFELTLPLDGYWIGQPGFSPEVLATLTGAFHTAHDTAYGFASPGEPIEFVSLRATTTGKLSKPPIAACAEGAPAPPQGLRNALFASSGSSTDTHPCPVYRREQLTHSQQILGPAIVEQLDTTVVIHPGDSAMVDRWGNLALSLTFVDEP